MKEILPIARLLSLDGVKDNRLIKEAAVPPLIAFATFFSLASNIFACLLINNSANLFIAPSRSSGGNF